jgi:hypothetical protein
LNLKLDLEKKVLKLLKKIIGMLENLTVPIWAAFRLRGLYRQKEKRIKPN